MATRKTDAAAARPDIQALTRCGAVVVAHARLDVARDCVDSLRRWLDADRIVVVVNVPAAVRDEELAGAARVISPLVPQGYGANLNLGVRALPDDAEYAVLANDDVVFEDESLPRLLEALRDPTIGIAGPQLRDADGSDATSYGRFPTVADAIRDAAILPRPLWARAQRRAPAAARSDFVVGAAVVVRRRSFEQIGGFDEDFFLNFEETDLCFRLRRAGFRTAWRRDAIVTHLQGSSISREQNYETFYASLRLYYRKRPGPLRWPLFEVLLATVFATGVAYSAAGAVLRPPSFARRLEEVRRRWRGRIFLRRSSPP